MKIIQLLTALVVLPLTPLAAGQIETEGIIDAPVAEVWAAWTTKAGLQSWLAPKADIDLRVDGLMRTQYDAKGTLGDAGTIQNRILCFDPERLLAIRVAKAPDNFPFRDLVGQMWSVLYFTPVDAGRTQLRIVGLGFGDDEDSRKMKDFFVRGNAFTLQQLQQRFRPAAPP